MKMNLTNKRPYEFSVGELFDVGTLDKLDFNIAVYYNEETEKYEPITPKKSGVNVAFRVLREYFVDKYKCRFMQMMSDQEPSVEDMQEHLTSAFSRFLDMKKHSLSSMLCLSLNYYDPLYNYDRMEVYDESTTTDYKGSETDKTTYNGSEKDTTAYSGTTTDSMKKKGYEQHGVNGYDATQDIGKTRDTNEVTGYNSPDDFTNESRSTSEFLGTDTVSAEKVSIASGGGDGSYNLNLSGSGTLDGRVSKELHEVIETDTYHDREDVKETSFANRKDELTKTFTNRNDETVKSFNNRQDETSHKSNNHLFGNIGVTTSSALVIETYKARELSDVAIRVIEEFMNDYTFVM